MKKRRIVVVLLLALILAAPAQADGSRIADEEMLASWAEMDSAEVSEETFLEEDGDTLNISAPYAILMERETGTVLYEKGADTRRPPASVTKIMTLLLTAEAIDSGTLSLTDTVTASAYAASMGGSQVYLKENEKMTVEELVKAVAVASANDGAVALAEHLAGTESAFVGRMNSRAQELGMTNTVFSNCTGLPCEGTHETTARDIAIMSRELLRHEWIRDYTTIWMDTLRDGEFGLSNTNKLIYYYDGATGLKTGFTQAAGYCISASAMRDGTEYIAVVLGCETSQARFESAKSLLSYAFSGYTVFRAQPEGAFSPIPVRMGTSDTVTPVLGEITALVVKKNEAGAIETKIDLPTLLEAPVEEGAEIGTFSVISSGKTMLTVPIYAKNGANRLSVLQIWGKLLSSAFGGTDIFVNKWSKVINTT